MKIINTLAAAVLASALCSGVSLAAPAQSSVLPMSDIAKRLQAVGYSNIKWIRFKDGFYQAGVLSNDGCKLVLNIDPYTGQYQKPGVIKLEGLTMADALKKAAAAGFLQVSEAEVDHGAYLIKALDPQGKKVKILVDPVSGNLAVKS